MGGNDDDTGEVQASVDEFPINPSNGDQCKAYAKSTGEQCQHPTAGPFPYCGDHLDLLDDVEKKRMGLKPPKSEV
jgi:hypothetical protein